MEGVRGGNGRGRRTGRQKGAIKEGNKGEQLWEEVRVTVKGRCSSLFPFEGVYLC